MIKKILMVSSISHRSGGKIYEKMVEQLLSCHANVEIISTGMNPRGRLKYLRIPFVLLRNFLVSQRKNAHIIIKDIDAALFINPKPVKNIVIVHHIDISFFPLVPRLIYAAFQKLTLWNIRKFSAIVTVSAYWYNYFINKGYHNVHLIYNAFDTEEFTISNAQIEKFKQTYHLSDKPIIYLGNCQKVKGVEGVYKALKDIDAYLVTSGEARVHTPALNLELSEKEYSLLLKAARVVINMSTFKEGWSRTAHQAMLYKTPVIGSGTGGMRELLEGGEQIICNNITSLKKHVTRLLHDPKEAEMLGERGYTFARQFTKERFEKEWTDLIISL